MNLPPGFTLVEEPEDKLPKGFVLDDSLPEGFVLVEEEETDVEDLLRLKESGQPLTEKQERILWKANEDKPLLQKASEAASTFFPAAAKAAQQIGVGGAQLFYKGVLKPIDAMSQSPEEAAETFKNAKNAWRSFASGVATDVEETADAAVRFGMFGSGITDWIQGLPEEERFKRYQNRNAMRQLGAAMREETPDRAAALLAENPFLQKAAGAYARLQNATPEEAKLAEQAFKELALESGLTKDELDENISMLGEFLSPFALPGANRATEFFAKGTGKVVQKAGEGALKYLTKPSAAVVEEGANLTVKGSELLQGAAKRIGEYTVNDPDTLIKSGVNTVVAPVVAPAKITRSVAGTVRDVLRQVDAGGAAGRRGMFERAGRSLESRKLTRQVFGPEGRGGVARAKLADWAVRQTNAIVQPGVNGAALNAVMGLPDIETGADLGEISGTGFGISGFAGSRAFDRTFGLIDPTTSMAQKINNFITPDTAQRRRDEDADIKRFLATADPQLVAEVSTLADINRRKTALDSMIINLKQRKERTINLAAETELQRRIDSYQKQRDALEKATPQTQTEALRQTHLAFIDAMDLAQSTGGAAGIKNLKVKILNPTDADGFFRNLYGKNLSDAESTVQLLTGVPQLSNEDAVRLQQARETIAAFDRDVANAKNTRGFAVSEDNADPNRGDVVPAHLRKVGHEGATVVINGELLKHLSEQGFDVRRVMMHETQHALGNFKEVQELLKPIREYLFDQKIQNADGTFTIASEGVYRDEDLDRFADAYAIKMSPNDGGASFRAQFDSQESLRTYIKEEVLSEMAAAGGDLHGGSRAALDDVGRSVVDWVETTTKNGFIKRLKEGLRGFGIIVDDAGGYSKVLGAEFTPESLAMFRQYQRQLRDLQAGLVFNQQKAVDEPDIPIAKIVASRALQEKFKNADLFEKENIIRATAPDGSVTELAVPQGAALDPFIDVYTVRGGQIVDSQGNPVQLGPMISVGSLPEGTKFEAGTRIARNTDGSPRVLTNREMQRRAIDRAKAIRNAFDSAKNDDSPSRLIDTGNGSYRGTMSQSQRDALLALPNTLVAPELKRKILFLNEILGRRDGTRVIMDYQAALLNGKYRSLAPKIRDEIPIGFQFSKDGNFLVTTMSVSRMYDKAAAWAAQQPVERQTWLGETVPEMQSLRLQLWNGDIGKFWDSVMKYLDNHNRGVSGSTDLHPDPAIALRMKNRINDLFNAFNAETKDSNPERTKLPKRRGEDPLDVVVRSRRLDRILSLEESALQKMPINYELLTQNYMPEENPLAGLQSPEDFSRNINGSVSATEIRNAIRTDRVDQLESKMRDNDDLRPFESIHTKVVDGIPQIQIVSMFDPANEASIEPEEVVRDLDRETNAEIQRIIAQQLAQDIAPDQEQRLLNLGYTKVYRGISGEKGGLWWTDDIDAARTYAMPPNYAVEVGFLPPNLRQVNAEGEDWNAQFDVEGIPADADVVAGKERSADAPFDYNAFRVADDVLERMPRTILEQQQPEPQQPEQQQLEEPAQKESIDVENYRSSLEERIPNGAAFENAVVAPAGLQYLPAFHGSPFDFDRFDINKIGEGEGSQAFGYGLYFAGLRQVGEGYQAKLAKDIRVDGVTAPSENEVLQNTQIRDALDIFVGILKAKKSNTLPIEHRAIVNRAIRMLNNEQLNLEKNDPNYILADNVLNWWFDHGSKGLKDDSKIQYGTLYKVDLDVEESDLLDWDKPLSEQSKKIQDAVLPIIIDQFDKLKKAREAIVQRGTRLGGYPFRPGELERLKKPMPDPLTLTGKSAYINVTNHFGGRPAEDSPKASAYLLDRGVSGIQYWDAFSRGAGEGTRNYVIFDDKLIKILEKDDKPVGSVLQFMPDDNDFAKRREEATKEYNRKRDEVYQTLYSVMPEAEEILRKKNAFADDQATFNSIPISPYATGFNYDRSFHLTKIVRRILDDLDPMGYGQVLRGALRRQGLEGKPEYEAELQKRIENYKDIVRKNVNATNYTFKVLADLTASLPEIKARDLRQDKIVSPWMVLQKHFPNGEKRDINEILLELRDVIKFGVQEENFKSSINDVLNAAEVLRDFVDVDQTVMDQLFKDRYNKTENEMIEQENEFLKEITNPEFYDVEKQGSATFSKKIEPQGGTQFMPAEVDTRFADLEAKAKAGDKKAEAEAIAIVENIAKNAGGIEAWHFGSFDPSYDPIPKTKKGMHFGSKEASIQRAFDKQPEDERRSLEIFEENGLWYWKTNTNESLDGFSTKQSAEKDANNAIAEMWMNQDYDYNDLGSLTKTYLFFNNLKTVKDQGDNWNDIIIKSKEEGYDGLKYKNEFEDKGSTSYVIFNPQQAKSADPFTYDDAGALIPLSERFQTSSPDIRFMPPEDALEGIPPVTPPAVTPANVEKTLQRDAGDFSVVIGGKPGRYGFGYTTIVQKTPALQKAMQMRDQIMTAIAPRMEKLETQKDALIEVGNFALAKDELDSKQNLTPDDLDIIKKANERIAEFEKTKGEYTLDDAKQITRVQNLTREINQLKTAMMPAPFKFPVDKNVSVDELQASLSTIFKTKKFRDFIEEATGVKGIRFDNIVGTWKYEVEPSFVFAATGMTWEQSQTVAKWLSFLLTQDAGIAWKPSVGLTNGASAVYLVHDKKLTDQQIKDAFAKAEQVGIDGLSLTVDGRGIKAANFDGIEGFYDKLAEIQKSADIKNYQATLVDSFYYDTTSDFTAEDGSVRVPDWLIARQTKGGINETDIQDQQGTIIEELGESGGNIASRGLTVLLRRGIDTVLVPYAKALAGQGFTFDADLWAQRFGLGQAEADYIREKLYPKQGTSRSVSGILDGREKLVVPESYYTKEGKLKTSVNDLLYALQNRSAQDGFVAPGDYSKKAGQVISETIVDEILGHINRAKKNPNAPNAIGWYDAALKRMKERYAKFFPFLNRNSSDYDANKEFVFDAVLGITSQGNNVFENGKMATRVQFLLQSGKSIPEIVQDLYGTFGGQTRAIEENFLKLNELINNNDIQKLDKLFRKKMSVSDWNAYLKKNKNLYFKGKPLSVDGQADQMVTGFSVFGPKIGSFINNLHGDYSTLTADLWFTRTWNRILGNVFQHAPLKEANQYNTFRNALLEQYRNDAASAAGEKFDPLVKKVKEGGTQELFDYFSEPELSQLSKEEVEALINDPQRMLDLATALEDRFRTGQYKEKSDLRRAAKNWVENRSDPVAAPRTDLERDFQQSVMELAQKKLRKQGIDISIADMQAALWYNEKELFGMYGAQVSGAEPADYSDAAENVEELMGYGSLFQLERMVKQPDGTNKKQMIRLVPYNDEIGLTKIQNPKTPEEYAKLVEARDRAADQAKKQTAKIEKAELKVAKLNREFAEATDEKEKRKIQDKIIKAEKALADLKPVPVQQENAVGALTEIKPPVE